jgi:hypothetical protein
MEKNTDNRSSQNNLKLRKTVYYLLGIIETFFAFRLIFKLLGANAGSTFVSLIYSISGAFMAPFSGIFRTAVTKGIETKSVLEPATIIAMIVYAVVAYGIVRLIEIYGTPKRKEIE